MFIFQGERWLHLKKKAAGYMEEQWKQSSESPQEISRCLSWCCDQYGGCLVRGFYTGYWYHSWVRCCSAGCQRNTSNTNTTKNMWREKKEKNSNKYLNVLGNIFLFLLLDKRILVSVLSNALQENSSVFSKNCEHQYRHLWQVKTFSTCVAPPTSSSHPL